GKPGSITVDHGTAFTSQVFDDWRTSRVFCLTLSTPVSLENGSIESFNGKLRDECLNAKSVLVDRRYQEEGKSVTDGLQPSPTAWRAGQQGPGGLGEQTRWGMEVAFDVLRCGTSAKAAAA